MHVQSWLYGAGVSVESYDYVGTDVVTFEYTYDLFGRWQADGTFHVEYGEWTGDSRDYHPDFVTVLPEPMKRKSRNPEVDPAVVDNILAGS